MKVQIVKDYRDITKNKKLIKAGTKLIVSEERGKVLINAKVAKEIETKNE